MQIKKKDNYTRKRERERECMCVCVCVRERWGYMRLWGKIYDPSSISCPCPCSQMVDVHD